MRDPGDLRQTILVVDDMADNISLLTNILAPLYKVRAANNGDTALKVAFSSVPDLILLDVMMPVLDGYEVCRRLKADQRTRAVPLIFVTALGEIDDERRGFELGAVDYITKPISPPLVLARVRTHLQLYHQNRSLEDKISERTNELAHSRLEIVRRLGLASEFRDNETGMHVIRMSYYARLIATAIGIPESEAEIILNAAPMHDVGKIGIPDRILLKPGPLDPEERAVMERHAELGAQIIGDHDDPLLATAKLAALTHHERWDGNGYPHRLKGDQIPLIGRILAVADVFDALTSERPYKKAWTLEGAADFLENEAGHHFDPVLVRAFLDNLPEVRDIMKKNTG